MPKILTGLTVAAIGVSLGMKAMLPQPPREADPAPAADELSRLAAVRGYDAHVTMAGAGILVVVARYGDCQRRLFFVGASGSQVAKVETLRQPGERKIYHYRGRERASFPRLEPVAREQLQAYLARFGGHIGVPAVVAELSAGRCRAAPPLPLGALRVTTA